MKKIVLLKQFYANVDCCRNSRLLVDEDDFNWVANEKKCYY